MSEIKNRVMVELYNLKLTEKKDDLFGKVLTAKSLSEDNLISIAISHGTDINAETFRAAFGILKKILYRELANGASVAFGPGFLSLDVKGVFIGEHAKWDPAVNSLHIKVTANSEFREILDNVHVDVIGIAHSGTIINVVTDASSGEDNTCLTPGGAVSLEGLKIRIAGDDDRNGITLINQGSMEEYDIPMTAVPVNEPKKVVFIVPSGLPAGDYKLRLATQYTSGGKLLKEPRAYLFNCILKAEPVVHSPQEQIVHAPVNESFTPR